MTKRPSEYFLTCPMERTPSIRRDRFIGRLGLYEFDIIDLLIVQERILDMSDIHSLLGIDWSDKSDTRICRIVRAMHYHTGLLGVLGYLPNATAQATPQYGPTMKGIILFHEALKEDVPHEYYKGCRWVAPEGTQSIYAGGTGGAPARPLTGGVLASLEFNAQKAV